MKRSYSERLEKSKFRKSIVLMIVDLSPEERSLKIDELVSQTHEIPFSKMKRLSKPTIYRWFQLYELELASKKSLHLILMPVARKDEGVYRTLTKKQIDALKAWRIENWSRTVEDLREELMEHEETRENVPSVSTITRFLRLEGFSRKDLKKIYGKKPKVRLPYEAEYPQQIYFIDTKGVNVSVRVSDDEDSEIVPAMLIVILDGYSRYIVSAAYVLTENESAVMMLLYDAFSKFGVSELLYTDLGGPYIGGSLESACTHLCCQVRHAPKREPEAKGLVERPFNHFYERLEREILVKRVVLTLDELNEALSAYINQDYHVKNHSITNVPPPERFFELPEECRRFVSDEGLTMIFLPCRKSKVSKVGMIRHDKKNYLAPEAVLFGKWVEIRIPLNDTGKVYVWFEDKYYGEAYVFIPGNDYLKRQEILSRINKIPEPVEMVNSVPIYSRYDRQLARHRAQLEEMSDLNEELKKSRVLKEKNRALFNTSDMDVKNPVADLPEYLDFDELTHLLAKLLCRAAQFTASERMFIRYLWTQSNLYLRNLFARLLGNYLVKGFLKTTLKNFLMR